MATYAIGDIHGCFSTLERLLEEIDYDADRDRIWLVGDLVNGGPDSLEVMRWAHQLPDDAVVVPGNHDLHMLAVAAGAQEAREADTFTDVLEAPDADELLDWLRHRPLVHRERVAGTDWMLTHAGLLPDWSPEEAERLAGEVEARLRGPDAARFLNRMYGNEPRGWDDSLTGIERHRVIVNALTRMRAVNADGTMDFDYKGTLADMPEPLLPWFGHPARQSADITLVFGHWSAIGYHHSEHIHALDSGCVWGHRLTALRLDDEAVFQVDSERERVEF